MCLRYFSEYNKNARLKRGDKNENSYIYYFIVTTQAKPNRPRLWRERLGLKLRGYRPEPHKNKRIKFIYYLMPEQLHLYNKKSGKCLILFKSTTKESNHC